MLEAGKRASCPGLQQKGCKEMKLDQEKKKMLPPWLACPEIERYSIGWRMGYGEDYICRFFQWWRALSEKEQKEYRGLFPEPVTWKGWWDDSDAGEVLVQGDFCIPLWRPEGEPKYSRPLLQQAASEGRQQDFVLFWGHRPSKDWSITQSCLSQWWMADFRCFAVVYCCMEQFMMAQKAELFGDGEIQKQIMESREPDHIKALGRKVQNFDQAVWDRVKYSIVLNGNWCKFSQNRPLRDFLLSTGDRVLAEASPYDAIWGIQLSADSPDAKEPGKWRGRNLLGFALMEVRDELRRVTKHESLCRCEEFEQRRS